jgi:hypothetical protein
LKIFVFSDTHGDLRGVERVLDKTRPNVIIHLGDAGNDADNIGYAFPDIEIHAVRGNSDYIGSHPREKLIATGGKNIYLTHGHLFNLKNDLTQWKPDGKIVVHAAGAGADIVLFGHTHVPYLGFERGMHIMNPGSASTNKNISPHPTCGVIELNGNDIMCKLICFNYL